MLRPGAKTTARRATNVTLPVDLLAQARVLGLNISQVCEQGLVAEIAKNQAEQWLEENRSALVSSRDYVEQNGLPLAEFRQF